MNMPIRTKEASGLNHVNGIVRGRINGVVTGTMNAIVRGDLNAFVEAGNITPMTEEEYEDLASSMPMRIAEKKDTPSDKHKEDITQEKNSKDKPQGKTRKQEGGKKNEK